MLALHYLTYFNTPMFQKFSFFNSLILSTILNFATQFPFLNRLILNLCNLNILKFFYVFGVFWTMYYIILIIIGIKT